MHSHTPLDQRGNFVGRRGVNSKLAQ